MERNVSELEGWRVCIRCLLSYGHEEIGGKPYGKVNVAWNQVKVILSVVDGTQKRTLSREPSTTSTSNEKKG